MIDRIIPRFLASDKDQRFTDEGVMVEASNVTLTEAGEKSGNILKNSKSNAAIPPDSTAFVALDSGGNPEDVKIIGSIEDDKNNHVYFFVASEATDTIEGEDDHTVFSAIYRYELSTLEYTLILNNVHLKFDSNSFVKADIIHGTFGENIDENPLIYFTDNINPPRKINVDRALNGEYNQTTREDFNFAVSVMRAAPTKAPTISFESDETVTVNSIDGNFFQFATQIIYSDGEESAVGPYSEIAICRPTFLNALTSTSGQNFGVERLVDNVIIVDLNVDLTIPGIDKINVLCRNGNDSNWFISDSFKPYADVKRNISGQEKNIFEAGSNRYKFYNDTIGAMVPPVTTQKSYDNVPLKARGQSIVKNRLFYSNYEEGFGNVNAGEVKIEAKYSDQTASSSEAFPSSVWDALIEQGNCGTDPIGANTDIVIDLSEGNGYTDENTSVGAGTKYNISFKWAPSASVTLDNISNDDVYLKYEFPITYRNEVFDDQGDLTGMSQEYDLGTIDMSVAGTTNLYYSEQTDTNDFLDVNLNTNQTPFVPNKRKRYSFSYTQSTDGNLGDVAIGLRNAINDSDLRVKYSYLMPVTFSHVDDPGFSFAFTNDTLSSQSQNIYGDFDTEIKALASQHKVVVTWNFEVVVNDVEICLKPYIEDIEMDRWFKNYTGGGAPLEGGPTAVTGVQWDGSSLITGDAFSGPGSLGNVTINTSFNPSTMYTNGGFSTPTPVAGSRIYIKQPVFTFIPTSNDQEDLEYASLGSTVDIASRSASAVNVSITPTFKAGSTHSFGIVYYDAYGRHGFVNPIGSMYAKYPNERGTPQAQAGGEYLSIGAKEGVVSAKFEFSEYDSQGLGGLGSYQDYLQPPSWAKSWQIVYGGSNLQTNFIQYEAFSAYPELKIYSATSGANPPLIKEVNEETMRIYVRLENLNEYQRERGVSKSYSFTKGDKLRVIKYKESENMEGTNDFVFPTANDGSLVEFDVVGNAILTRSLDNPIDPGTTDATLNNEGKYEGEFIILESPRINTGLTTEISGSTVPLKYVGFDWQSVAKFHNPNDTFYYQDADTTVASNTFRWGRRTIVDIVTPTKNTAEKIYYEIGTGGKVAKYNEAFTEQNARGSGVLNNHGLSGQNGELITNNGDAWFRPVAMKGPKWYDPTDGDHTWSGIIGGSFNYTTRMNEPDKLSVYTTQIVEDSSLTDKIASKSWNKGRPHAVYAKAKQVRRYNSITYSQAYNVDVQELTLSDFNAGLVNYADLSNKYGAINYIGNYEDMLFAAQENKVSITPIERAVLNQAAGGDGVVSLSSAVINDANTNYMAGDWGIGDNPESVLIYDTQIFFADPSRARVVRLTREGLSAISDKGMSEVFNEQFRTWLNSSHAFKRVVSGYDPSDNVYYISLVNPSAFGGGKTYGYDVQRGIWQSEYSFVPDLYSRQNDDMFTFNQSGQELMWVHNVTNVRNRFYGATYQSKFKVVSKYNPSMSKIYKAIGINGGTAFDTRITSSVGHDTGTGSSVMPADSYALREGQHYREIPGDTSNVDSQHYFGVGKCESVSGNSLIMENIQGMSIPTGLVCFYTDGSSLSTGGFLSIVASVNHETNTITTSGSPNGAFAGKEVILGLSTFPEGNPQGARIRGHYVEVELESPLLTSGTPFEVYSIDLNYENSRPNYALGQ